MEKSDKIEAIALALCEFQSKIEPLSLNKSVKVKTKKGGEYSFKYATFAEGIEKIKLLLKECELSYSQIVESNGGVTTILMHKSGQYIMGNLHLKTEEETPQAIGSMITYAKRYSLFSMLGVVADDDDDGGGAAGNTTINNDDPDKPWLNKGSKEWKHVVNVLTNGGATDKDGVWVDNSLKDVMKKFKVSKANQEELKKISKNG